MDHLTGFAYIPLYSPLVSGEDIYIYVKKERGRRGHPTTSHLSLRLGFRATRAEAVCVCGRDIFSGFIVRVGYAVLSCIPYGNDRLR